MWQTQHPHNNIAAATGISSGIFVVDLDPGSGADATVRKLASQANTFRLQWRRRSPRDGRHLYYAYDRRATITKAHSLGQGIDTRGNGGYIVLPPSWWRDAQSGYRWWRRPVGGPRASTGVGDCSSNPAPAPRGEHKPADLSDLTGYRRQAFADLDKAVRRIARLHDGRHEAPFKAAALLGKYVYHGLLTEADLEGAILSACGSNGALEKYKRDDLCRQIRNGLNKARGDALPELARSQVAAQQAGSSP